MIEVDGIHYYINSQQTSASVGNNIQEGSSGLSSDSINSIILNIRPYITKEEKNYPVTSISAYAFWKANAEQIILPSTIISLGWACFGCTPNLKYIHIPSDILITDMGLHIFWGSYLKYFDLPTKIKNINANAFESSNIEDIYYCGNGINVNLQHHNVKRVHVSSNYRYDKLFGIDVIRDHYCKPSDCNFKTCKKLFNNKYYLVVSILLISF